MLSRSGRIVETFAASDRSLSYATGSHRRGITEPMGAGDGLKPFENLSILLLFGGMGWSQVNTQDAIQDVIDTFKSANLVALGERHWAREDSEFRLKLIRHPAFAQTVTDVVVEFANPLYQDLLDRFVNGQVEPSNAVRKIWQDTTQPGAWDSPIYEDFLYAVREVNAGLPGGKRVRVLAGDQQVNWSQSLGSALKDERDSSAASVIGREILNRGGRKALVLFGSAHIYRNRPGTVVEILRYHPKAKWFVIVPVGGSDLSSAISAEKASPSSPEFVLLGHNPVGNLYANDLLEKGTKRVKLVDGNPVLVDGKPVFVPVNVFEPNVRMRQVADACLYFGSAPPQLVQPPAALYSGTDYGKEVQRRRAIMSGLH